MRLTILYLFMLLFSVMHAQAQPDSVAFTVDSQMSDGVYLTYADFRHNAAVSKAQIHSPIDPDQLNFIEKTLLQEKLVYTLNGQSYTVDSKSIWGYFQNNTLHVNYKGDFYRVPMFGSISYLVATVLVRTPSFYTGMGYGMGGMGAGMGPTYTQETHEFLINFYDGYMQDMAMDKAEALLGRDKALYDEFMALGSRKRKDQLYRFIRRYNAAHPVYFLR